MPRSAVVSADHPVKARKGKAKAAKAAKGKAKGKMQIVHTNPDAPGAKLSKSFVHQAEKLDGQIVKTLERIDRDVVGVGEMFREMKEKGFHVALGFPNFAAYVDQRCPNTSKSQVFQAMRIVRELTSGPNPSVSREDVKLMPKDNAEGLASLRQRGVEITPNLIEAAKSLPIRRFQEEIVLKQAPDLAQKAAVAKGTVIADAPTMYHRKVLMLSSETMAELEHCAEIARYVVRDDVRDVPFDDKFLQSMCAEYRSNFEADYNVAKANEEAEAQLKAEEQSANGAETTSIPELTTEPDAEYAESVDDEDEEDEDSEAEGDEEEA
jgi:hypothetical protein